jgi:hypothetical protein
MWRHRHGPRQRHRSQCHRGRRICRCWVSCDVMTASLVASDTFVGCATARARATPRAGKSRGAVAHAIHATRFYPSPQLVTAQRDIGNSFTFS